MTQIKNDVKTTYSLLKDAIRHREFTHANGGDITEIEASIKKLRDEMDAQFLNAGPSSLSKAARRKMAAREQAEARAAKRDNEIARKASIARRTAEVFFGGNVAIDSPLPAPVFSAPNQLPGATPQRRLG